ncbi:MAG: patatin-like phospholipase family protein [Alphaproteobacteria bacterium]|nr:patatin-like phospholipase family protein [Alphaproteobacteria bacterium]
MPHQSFDVLATVEPFSRLPASARAKILQHTELIDIPSGELLIRQGQPAKRLFIVLSGRFAVLVEPSPQIVAQIGVGQPIGEIAFFAGGLRTANVRAERDSIVLALTRDEFDALAGELPELWPTVAGTLATRLTQTTAGRSDNGLVPPKTIAICRAGSGPLHQGFIENLRQHCSSQPGILFLDAAAAKTAMSTNELTTASAKTAWFNALEQRYERIIYVCDATVTDWTQKALHQADQVLLAADARTAGQATPNDLERLTATLHDPQFVRLALLHSKRSVAVEGTGNWLASRPFVGAHHHLAVGEADDIARLMRFVTCTATGLVASGGGAFTAAHIGMYQALQEAGYEFDYFGGTSGGAAMTAAFASDVDPADVDQHTHDMFVARKAMARWNWPRYSMLDHRVFDEKLAEFFPTPDIADLWVPYFAVASNLSTNALEIIRRGPLWKAIRASAAIPALFPPVFSNTGEMLVDGCLIDNVPLGPMRSLKCGPNVVLDLKVPHIESQRIDTARLPSRTTLMRKLALGGVIPAGNAPGPHTVLLRSLLRETRDVAKELHSGDRLLTFTVPDDANVLDWSNHRKLRWAAYDFARQELASTTVKCG